MIRGQVRTLIRKKLGETTSAFWTDPELNGWIDLGGHDVAKKTKCIKRDGYITTTGNGEYTLSTSFPKWLSVLRVYLKEDGNTWVKIKQTDEDCLDREEDGWRSADSSTPYKYYWDKERDILGLYPKANSDNQGTNYLRVYYASDYTNATNDNDDMATTLSIPFDLQLAIVDYVMSIGYETRGWGDKANDALQKYSARMRYYLIDVDTEKQVDDEALVMKNYRNI